MLEEDLNIELLVRFPFIVVHNLHLVFKLGLFGLKGDHIMHLVAVIVMVIRMTMKMTIIYLEDKMELIVSRWK